MIVPPFKDDIVPPDEDSIKPQKKGKKLKKGKISQPTPKKKKLLQISN